MVNFFEIGVNIIENLIIFSFLTMYFGCKFKGIKKVLGFIAAITIAVLLLSYFNSLYIYEGFLGLVFIGVNLLYALLLLKGDFYTKLFISGFMNCLVYFLALFSTLFVSIISGGNNAQLYNMTGERLALIVISKILLLAVCIILLKFKFNYMAKKRDILVLIIMPIVAELSMVGIMQAFLKYDELKNNLMLASVSVMVANILTYYVFIKINKDIQIETELNAINQKYENDKKHAQDIEELYSKTCGLRHDLLIHFTTLSKLIDENKDKAQDYIKTVTHNEIDEIRNFVQTGNDCFDAIVNAKIALCEKLGINVQARIMENSLARLKHDEIVIIFGNLFDNAIEASKNSEKKSIQLDIQIQGAYLSILMKNSIDSSVLDNNNLLKTTKSDAAYHGFGIKNIRRIVNKYRGIMNYDEDNGYFFCDILLL